MGGCHIEEGGQEGNMNRLEGGEGVTGDHSGRKGLLPAQTPQSSLPSNSGYSLLSLSP